MRAPLSPGPSPAGGEGGEAGIPPKRMCAEGSYGRVGQGGLSDLQEMLEIT